MSPQCRECGAKCCKYFCFEIDKPETYEEFEDVRWYLCHKDVSIHIDEGDWYMFVANRCRFLRPNHLCAIYDDRPLICRDYTQDNCDHIPGEYDYDKLFETPEQLEAYARKVLGKKKFEAARAKARAKVEKKHRKTGRSAGAKRKSPGRKNRKRPKRK